VLGLFRQFWIPKGMTGAQGAYVRFPSDDLLGILALESTRAGALVVGEDLGTVPEEVPAALERWGILSSKVLYFERDGEAFRPARSYAPMALATANTHDLAPLAGWWRGRDLDLREELGHLGGARAVRQARAIRAAERQALFDRLADEGLLPPGEVPASDAPLRAAAHAFLRRTPSWLVGLSLDDLAGETEPVNLPGARQDEYPCWTRRMARSLEALRVDPGVRRALGVERVWVASEGAGRREESESTRPRTTV
jgi:4-alpha-glucanotransferase